MSDDEESDELYYARKLGLLDKSGDGRKKLEEEFIRDGFGEDFLSLFDFLDEARETHGVDDSATEGNNTVLENSSTPGKYIPPHLRTGLSGGTSKRKRQLSLLGLLNRLSEGNLDSVSADIVLHIKTEKIAPADIASLLVGMACENPHITLTLQATYAALACALAIDTAPSNNYSGAILAAIVHRMKSMGAEADPCRTMGNYVRMTAILFSYGLFSAEVIESVLKYLSSKSDTVEHRLDWILVCLRFSGRVLKDYHPQKFQVILPALLEKLTNISPKSKQAEFGISELKSMLDNKSSFRAIDHMQSACEWLSIREGAVSKKPARAQSNGWKVPKSVEQVQLICPFSDVFANEFPIDWIKRSDNFDELQQSSDAKNTNPPISLEELAVLNRMTTEVKRNAFISIMGAVDAKHALNRLEKFGVLSKPKNIPSIVQVIVHCALQEPSLNPFYIQIIRQLCIDGLDKQRTRKFSISLKIELSSKVSDGKLASDKITILSQLISAFVTMNNGEVSVEDILKPSKKHKLDDSRIDSDS